MTKIRGKYLLVLIAACGMASACMGMIANIAGLFFAPIAEDWEVGRGAVSVTLTIYGLVFALAGMATPKLVTSERFKSVLVIATLVTAGGTALLAVAPNLIVLYALNLIRGAAAGIMGNVLITIMLNNWFFEKNGLVISIAMGFCGISAAVISPPLAAIIQDVGWRTGYLVAAVVIVLWMLPAILLPITFRPQDVGLEPLGGSRVPVGQAQSDSGRTTFSWLLVLCMLYAFLGCFIAAYPQHFPGIAESYGQTVAVGSLMLSISLVMNTGGKIVFGYLTDRIGTKRAILLYAALVAIGAFVLLTVRNPFGLYGGAALVGLCAAVGTVGSILVTRDLFGVERYSKVFPIVNLLSIPANAVGASAVGFAYDASGNYDFALVSIMVLMVSIMVVVVLAYRLKKKTLRK